MKYKTVLLFLLFAFCSQGISEEEAAELVAEAVAEAVADAVASTSTTITTTTLPPTTTTSTTTTSTTTTSTTTTSTTTTTTTLPPTTTTTLPIIDYLPKILDINYENVSGNIGFSVTIQDKNNVFDPDDLELILFNESRIFFNNGEKTYSNQLQEGLEYAFDLQFNFNVCAGPISTFSHPNKTGVGCFPATSAYFSSPSQFDKTVPYSYKKIDNQTFKFGGNFKVGNRNPEGRGLLTIDSIKTLKNYFKNNSSAGEYYIVLTEISYRYGYYSCEVEWKFSDNESSLLKIQNNELEKYYEKPNSYHRDGSVVTFGYDQKEWCKHLDKIQLPMFSEPYEEVSEIKDGKITYTGEIKTYDWYVNNLDINKFVNESKLSSDSRTSYFEDTYGNKHLAYKLYP
jgi:hypothetical protein